MLAIGVGGADAVDALTGTPWELKAPQVVGACCDKQDQACRANEVQAFTLLASSAAGRHQRTLSSI